MAAQEDNVYILQKLGVWAEETQFNSFELKNKLFPVTDQYEVAPSSRI